MATRRVRLARNRNEVQFSRYRAWQWIKHLALADYVWPWASKVGSRAPIIHVVDLFAGKGTYVDVLDRRQVRRLSGSRSIRRWRNQRQRKKKEREKRRVAALTAGRARR